ncbi:ATP-binding protein [Phenylobacterium sp. J426]|uniref:ATP-binding protein n=1 Tax=Phenylobacterium sp. J426 TaxID=2898439 RepID=UPI002151D9F0|nr:ATP-binding protein [Phenylobacterium sp. J426]MCR5874292.1 ATP-binding protein [Phenylobacterium sp. J426]
MPAARWKVLDERLDIVARTRWEVLTVRSAAAVVAALLSIQPFGVLWSIGWFACFAVTEAGARLVSRAALSDGVLAPRARLAYLLLTMLAGLVWCALAVRGWVSGQEALRLAAVAVLVTVLIHAIGFSSRTPVALLAMCAPAALLWLALPLALGGYEPGDLMIVGFGTFMALAYVLAAAWATKKNAQALEDAERRAKEASETKSAFLGMVSHEIRTPMNGVMGMARALQATQLTSQQREYLDTIIRSGDALMDILNDVLDHTKIEAGRLELNVAPFNLRLLGEQSVQLWSEAAAAKNLELICEIDPELPAYVQGDEARVRQIVQNLLSNALKFTGNGRVTLAINRSLQADGESGVEILVRDTGPGMSADQTARLFRPFVQAEASAARRYGGTGLGLSICRTLCSMMGGEIGVESRPGDGATFRVRLPLPPAEITPVDTQPSPKSVASSLSDVRILVTDDNPINLAVARALLRATGASVETAAHGVEALDRVQTDLFDVLLMDVHMPDFDGVEVVRHIRAGLAGPQDVPVVALTGQAGPGEEDRLRTLGFDALHTKPIRQAELVATILRVLEHRRRDRDVA